MLVLLVAPAVAQVPQHTTFTGLLVDDFGDPLAGPVNLELRVFDAATMGTQLYSEQHLSVELDPTGQFSVQLGLGTSPSGIFGAALFSDVDRWLEVVVGTDVLAPRRVFSSVPWALIAQQANEIVRDPNGPFKDCGDGTVADPQTGLQWEKKAGTVGAAVVCATSPCPDPHQVRNLYERSETGTAPDGVASTDFVANLNDPYGSAAASASDVTGCYVGHCDWRLPTVGELQTIVDCSSGVPCIDPIFGPTASSYYWSASPSAGDPSFAWFASFANGGVRVVNKSNNFYVRAVRSGSCN